MKNAFRMATFALAVHVGYHAAHRSENTRLWKETPILSLTE